MQTKAHCNFTGPPSPPCLPSVLEGTCSQSLPTAALLKLDASTDLLTCPENLTPVSCLRNPDPAAPLPHSLGAVTTHPSLSAFTEPFGKCRRWLRWQGLPFTTPSPQRRQTLAHPQGLNGGLHPTAPPHRYCPKDQPRGPPVPAPSAEAVLGRKESPTSRSFFSVFICPLQRSSNFHPGRGDCKSGLPPGRHTTLSMDNRISLSLLRYFVLPTLSLICTERD